MDAAAVAVIAASVGGQVHNYSDVQALSFAASSAADLEAKLASLGAVDVASARANAALSNALKLGGVSVNLNYRAIIKPNRVTPPPSKPLPRVPPLSMLPALLMLMSKPSPPPLPLAPSHSP